MSNPSFHQAERRSLAVPLLLTVVLLAVAFVLARHFFPASAIQVEVPGTALLPTHTVFRSDSKVIGTAQAEDTLFVVSTVRIHNDTRNPLYLDGASCTFTNTDGRVLSVKAVERTDLANVETSFPQLSTLMAHPLTRTTAVEPGASAEGTLLFPFPLTEAVWRARKVATLEVDLYHQPPSYVDLPAEAGR